MFAGHSLTTRQDIGAALLDSIDQAIADLLGNGVTDIFYAKLRENGLARGDIPSRLDQFCTLTEYIFGFPSSFVIRRAIAKRLYARLGLSFESHPDWKLVAYVKEATRKLEIEA